MFAECVFLHRVSHCAQDPDSNFEAGLSIPEPRRSQPSLPAPPCKLYLFGRLLLRNVFPPLAAAADQQSPVMVARNRFECVLDEAAVLSNFLGAGDNELTPFEYGPT